MGKIQGFNDFTESLNEAKTKCPPATQDIKLNLRNRQKAIELKARPSASGSVKGS